MRIGFIGIGTMGRPMAANLAKGGHEIVAFDIDAAAAERFAVAHAATATADLVEIAAADVVITMLPTGSDVRSALLEMQDATFARALAAGTIVVDMSSSEPVGTRALGVEIARRGAVLIDAPVSGGLARAKTGQLTIMIGADDTAAREKIRPVLKLMGTKLFDTGGLGSGHAMKALNNFVAAAAFAATAEAMMIGDAFGLDPATMIDIMNVSTGRNFHTDVVMKDHVIGEKFASGFTVGLLAKDVGIAADLGCAMTIEAPLTRLVRERWAEARDVLGPKRDNTEAYRAWARKKG